MKKLHRSNFCKLIHISLNIFLLNLLFICPYNSFGSNSNGIWVFPSNPENFDVAVWYKQVNGVYTVSENQNPHQTRAKERHIRNEGNGLWSVYMGGQGVNEKNVQDDNTGVVIELDCSGSIGSPQNPICDENVVKEIQGNRCFFKISKNCSQTIQYTDENGCWHIKGMGCEKKDEIRYK